MKLKRSPADRTAKNCSELIIKLSNSFFFLADNYYDFHAAHELRPEIPFPHELRPKDI